ncbi:MULTISPECIES: acetyl-CoA hydrolase/transferase family protein [unclassified Shewanella]|uniref:acetyl-CoA hydrolase/transferase family protein n=1 Tax=unclassified Shewanella TaxID=196818 RepID=UPI001BC1C3A0|nr:MULTISPECIES: acetyl-CoA hydrolase/transferase C-terminal domain-containing protein [unclassified Shewanella]MCG9729566.1 4-hydroxybutyrate CoA-transferase [Shewanella sp. Isolate13]GIU19364.1 4-hydroxybutyrate CoA-transferase [Shewanella sp. MBTL60-007]
MAPIICGSALEAVSFIESGETLWTHSMGATPTLLLNALAEHALTKKDLTLLQLHTECAESLSDEKLKGHLRHRCFFGGLPTRLLLQQGDADYVPIFLSEVPKLFRSGEQPIDTAIIQVSPPDKHGICSLGISVEATLAACQVAGKIIAHINPQMPRTHGDGFIHYSKFTAVYEQSMPLPQHPLAASDEVSLAVGRNVAQLVRDGDCLQMGIGAIPDAVLSCLTDHKELGVHTELFSDGVLNLVELGVITNRCKQVHPGKIVTGFALGSQRLYDYVDDNPSVIFMDIEQVNDTAIIRKNPNMMAINSALQVDISGQICADSLGTRIYSGVGGQMDFIRGAGLSEGGRSVIALPSTAARGSVSRIATVLSPGAGVVTTRAHVHYIVTEFGIANLRGKSLRERARALIDIAHPDFREQLCRETFDMWGLTV